MNKTVLLIVGVVVIVLLGGLYFLNQKSQQESQMGEGETIDTMEDDPSNVSGQDNSIMEDKNDSYIAYSQNELDQAKDGRRVLFFYASWCPTCRPADADFSARSEQFPEDLTVIRVNYNDPETDEEEKALADKYNVTYQHTFVQIDSEGNEITKWNGGQTEELLNNIQ